MKTTIDIWQKNMIVPDIDFEDFKRWLKLVKHIVSCDVKQVEVQIYLEYLIDTGYKVEITKET